MQCRQHLNADALCLKPPSNVLAGLSSLNYFDVASGSLVPDIMHDILEGALPLEVKHMLKVCKLGLKL